MFKVLIKDLNLKLLSEAVFDSLEEISSWLDSNKPTGVWGKVAGMYPLSSLSASELASELSRLEIDNLDKPLSEPSIEIPDQMIVEITNISEQVEQERLNNLAKNFLAQSDYKILRHLGQKALNVPTTLSEEDYLVLEEQRQTARNSIIE